MSSFAALSRSALQLPGASSRSRCSALSKQRSSLVARTSGFSLSSTARTILSVRVKPCLAASDGGGGGGGSGGKKVTGGSGDGFGGDAESGKKLGLWEQYLALLETAPIMTRSVTCAILNGLGDVFCQFGLEGAKSLDAKRALTFTALGAFYVGPVLFYWYGFLGKLIPFGGMKGVLGSLAMDQLVFAPIFVGSFIAILTAIGGGSMADVEAKLRRDLFPAVQVNWCLWVPAQFINFKFVPPNLRVLATNVTALIWNTYMSYSSHKA